MARSAWKQFVQNRVSEIRELLPTSPESSNPADIPSRGLTPIELSTNGMWHCGPDWLHGAPDESVPNVKEVPIDCLTEMKSKETHSLLIVYT